MIFFLLTKGYYINHQYSKLLLTNLELRLNVKDTNYGFMNKVDFN